MKLHPAIFGTKKNNQIDLLYRDRLARQSDSSAAFLTFITNRLGYPAQKAKDFLR